MKYRNRRSVDEYNSKRISELERAIQSFSEDNVSERIQHLEESIGRVSKRLWSEKEVFTSSEAALYLGVSESYLYKLTSSKLIPHYKPNGKLVYFNKNELTEWAMRNPSEVTQLIPQNIA